MSQIISHNTEKMRAWSGDITKAQEEWNEYVNSTYTTIERYVTSEFTGGLSEDFNDSVLGVKDEFIKLGETLGECAEIIKNASQNIDDDEAALKQQINNQNVIN